VPESVLVNPAGTTVQVNLDGVVDDQGQRVWDFSVDDGSDQIAQITAQPLAGKWYASAFPSGQFVSANDLGGTLEAVYRKTDDTLFLLGLASSQEHPSDGQTLYVYDAPVALYHFPLAVGGSWTSVGEIHGGTFHGLPYAGTDTYAVSVVAAGVLDLPDLDFSQALQVQTTVTVHPSAGLDVVTQQRAWLFECYGEVARATSATGESNPDFTTAAEFRRFTLQRSTP
jgi:hypothetical protein